MASVGDNVGVDMMFDDDIITGGSSPSGAGGVMDDTMIGMFTELNIDDITEVFSPPRVVMQGMKIGLKAGSSMDLLTGWNFELKADRDRAIKQIDEEKPMLVIGSPPCTYLSMLQEHNKSNMRHDERWLARFNDNLIKAIGHIKFCIKLSLGQMEAGRYWLHEHPWSAKSWQIPEMEELLKDPRVQVAYADQDRQRREGTSQEAHGIHWQLLDDCSETQEDLQT